MFKNKTIQSVLFIVAIFAISLSLPLRVVFASSACTCFSTNKDCKTVFVDSKSDSTKGCNKLCSNDLGKSFQSASYATDSDAEATTYKCAQAHDAFVTETKKASGSSSASAPKPTTADISPKLNVEIPGLTFSPAVITGGTVKTNYLGEYINAIYKYLIGIAVTIAIVMVMIGGLQYVLASGGGSVEAGKKRIIHAVTGIVLLLSTYLILNTINPQLTSLKTIELQTVDEITLDFDSDDSTDDTGAPVPVSGEMKWCDPSDPNFVNMSKLCESNKCAGIKNVTRNGVENYLRKDTAQALINAGKIADKQGYYLSIRSKCRSLASQKKLAESSPDAVKSGTIAKPGNSPHSFGAAIDLVLMSKDNKSVSDGKMSSAVMCQASADGVAKLSKIMYSAGFVRLGTENWHFEYPAAKPFCRKKSFTGLAACVTGGKKAPCPEGS